MQTSEEYQNERLDHLGIVAGACREIGLVEWLDQQAGERRNVVSVGTATMAMVLNGLGFSNRQLYLVPQFFANKPVEHLLGKGISADMLNDDCLGRTLDWIADHDPTMLFAGIAQQARSRFGLSIKRIHADTTSFSVSGAYEQDGDAAEPACIAITHGYSRDHRADLLQWMLGLVTTHEGDVPLFMRPLDGNSSDKVSICAMVAQVIEQLRDVQNGPTPEEPLVVFDSGGYSQANMKAYNQAKIRWCSRVPETSTEAKAALVHQPKKWQEFSDQSGDYFSLQLTLPQGEERWVVIRTKKNMEATQKTLEKKANKDHEVWEKRLRHLGTQSFACQSDAEAAWEKEIKKLPLWLRAEMKTVGEPRYEKAGRPSANAQPVRTDWNIVASCQIDQQALEREIDRKARFIIATNELSPDILPDKELPAVYKGQGSAERGFRFLKDPLFLASSVFVKKPSRLIALSFIMVLCLLVYRLAEHRLRQRLQESQQTIPNQVNKPTDKPTMRWIFQCFEGIELLHIRIGSTLQIRVLRLQALHHKILSLLGPAYLQFYSVSP
jgi:transposase